MPRHNVRSRVITFIPFYDARLTPTQNKFLEMWRNNMTDSEIADEMDVQRSYVTNTISRLRFRYGDTLVPRRYVFIPSREITPKRSLPLVHHVHAYWVYLHRVKRISLRKLARMVGRSPGAVSGAIWRYER